MKKRKRLKVTVPMPNIPIQSRLFLLGDVHGDPQMIVNSLRHVPDGSTVLQVGDFGIGFGEMTESFLNTVNKLAKKLNITILAIRGNHDDPSFFNGQWIRSNIRLLEDYTHIDWNGVHILTVGGAVSIDRTKRELGKTYWLEEHFMHSPKDCEKCDILITHSCPSECLPIELNSFDGIKYWVERDKYLKEDILRERSDHRKLLEKANPDQHYCGHFHVAYNDGRTRILDINEIIEI